MWIFSLTSSRKIIALERVQKEQLQIEILMNSPRTPHFFSRGHPTRQRTPHFLNATPHKNQKSTPKTAVLKWVHFLSISSWQHKKTSRLFLLVFLYFTRVFGTFSVSENSFFLASEFASFWLDFGVSTYLGTYL